MKYSRNVVNFVFVGPFRVRYEGEKENEKKNDDLNRGKLLGKDDAAKTNIAKIGVI